MVTEALFVRMQPTPGQNSDCESFLVTGPFDGDTFPDDPEMQAQLPDRIAAVLMAMAAKLLTRRLAVERVDVPYARPQWRGEPSFEPSPVWLDRPPPSCKRRRTEDQD